MAVSQGRAAAGEVPIERAQIKTELLSGCAAALRRVCGRVTRRIKNKIRDICYYVLNRTEDKK